MVTFMLLLKANLYGGIIHSSTSEAIAYDKTDADADAMVLKLLISPELDAFYETIMDSMHQEDDKKRVIF